MNEIPQPTMSRSEQREVTLLFADMRGFTELAGTLHTDPIVCELLGHVMECLSEAVAQNDGYIVDYYGDGLVAMWNAPSVQPRHAELACRAGLQMLSSLPAVSDEWMNVTNTQLRLGIGVHTGSAQVGNAGSSQKAKYGPRGPNVNLASRVEAATKDVGLPLLATRATVEKLSGELVARRVCRAMMPGLQQPIDLFAIGAGEGDEALSRAWQTYEDSLALFERGELESAAATLATIDEDLSEVPRAFLVNRIQTELGRHCRRRATDTPAAHTGGVVVLGAK
jgi:adenylate cyclase